jgi:hypothetical protein
MNPYDMKATLLQMAAMRSDAMVLQQKLARTKVAAIHPTADVRLNSIGNSSRKLTRPAHSARDFAFGSVGTRRGVGRNQIQLICCRCSAPLRAWLQLNGGRFFLGKSEGRKQHGQARHANRKERWRGTDWRAN